MSFCQSLLIELMLLMVLSSQLLQYLVLDQVKMVPKRVRIQGLCRLWIKS